MSIAPPSDIILDVAQAADPLKLQAATAKLASMAAGAPASFDAALAAPGPARAGLAASDAAPVSVTIGAERGRVAAAQPDSVGRKFEAMVLQNFIDAMLPKNPDLFGGAESAEMSRGLMAEQLAAQISRTGRLGIAQRIDHSIAQAQAATVPPGTVPPTAAKG